jgi:hypothetical protein
MSRATTSLIENRGMRCHNRDIVMHVEEYPPLVLAWSFTMGRAMMVTKRAHTRGRPAVNA